MTIEHNLKTKIAASLQLMRLPNVFTAIADILAGYFIVRGFELHLAELFGLILATSGIYSSGCVLNDYCDRFIDARERPERPLPSGKIKPVEALSLSVFLFAVGLLGASFAGINALAIAAAIICLVILYDTTSKDHIIIGPLNMGACRAGNLLLGMSPALSVSITLVFPLISLFYIFFVTVLSHFETGSEETPPLIQRIVPAGLVFTFLILFGLIVSGYLAWGALIFLAMHMMLVSPPLLHAVYRKTPASAGRAVKFLILAIPFLDGIYVAGTQSVLLAIPVIFCLIPALFIARFFYVT